jgi:FkbM family methyltransferase
MKKIKDPFRPTKFSSMKILSDLGFIPSYIIDVGFGIGTDGLYDHFIESPAIIIEPIPEVAAVALDFVSNRRDTIFIQKCVSDYDGKIEIINRPGVTGSTIHGVLKKDNNDSSILNIECITLNSLFNKYALGNRVLIKIDVEGHEKQVLNGLKDNINEVEVFIIECSLYNDYNKFNRTTIKEIFDLLNVNFFLWDIIEPGYRSIDSSMQQFDAVFVRRNSSLLQTNKMKTVAQGEISKTNKINKILNALKKV